MESTAKQSVDGDFHSLWLWGRRELLHHNSQYPTFASGRNSCDIRVLWQPELPQQLLRRPPLKPYVLAPFLFPILSLSFPVAFDHQSVLIFYCYLQQATYQTKACDKGHKWMGHFKFFFGFSGLPHRSRFWKVLVRSFKSYDAWQTTQLRHTIELSSNRREGRENRVL